MRPPSTRGSLSPAAVGLLAAIVLGACSPGPGGASTTAAPGVAASPAASVPAGAATDVAIKDSSFSPATITVAAGTTVAWTNQDAASHTVTADDGSFDSKAIGNGASFSQTEPRRRR